MESSYLRVFVLLTALNQQTLLDPLSILLLLSFLQHSLHPSPFFHSFVIGGCQMIRPQETFGSHTKKWKLWQPHLPRLVDCHWLFSCVVHLWWLSKPIPSCLQDSRKLTDSLVANIPLLLVPHFSYLCSFSSY